MVMESLGRTLLKFVSGAIAPLGMAWLGYLVLVSVLGWPPGAALVGGIVVGGLGRRMSRNLLGPGASGALAGRTLLTALLATSAAVVVLVVVRGMLLLAHSLPGTATLVGCGAGLLVLLVTGAVAADRGGATFLRGRRVIGAWLGRQKIAQWRRRYSRSTDPSPVWLGIELPPEAADTHYLVSGMTGSGKTTVIKLLMQSVLPVVGTGRGHRALVYDDKQDLYPFLHALVPPERIVTLNPFDERCHGWDIAADVTDPATARQVAATLVPAVPGARDVYFEDAARDLVAGVMTAFLLLADGRWTFRDLVLALQSPSRMELVLQQTSETANLVETLLSARSTSDIISTVRTKIAPLRPVAAAWHRANLISLSDWIAGEGVLVLSNDELLREPLQVINQVLVNRLSQLLLAQPEPVTGRTWVFLDEMREARRLEGMLGLLLRGRSKKVTGVIGFQTIEGLREAYGNNVADELTGQCRTIGLMVSDSIPSREWSAKLIGQAEYVEVQRSLGGKQVTGNENRQLRDVVLPSQFATLPRLQDQGILAGWCLTPFSPPFYTEVRGAELARRQVAVPNVPSYQRRPAADQFLGDWDEEDYARLGLPLPDDPTPGSATDGGRETTVEPDLSPPPRTQRRPFQPGRH